MATEDTAKRPFWYLDGGDAVRALACLGIVCFHVGTGALYASGNLEGSGGHFTWVTGYGEAGHILLRSASTGFYMFFVLSGFLVSAPFVAAFVEGRPRPRLVPFLRNRAVRLLPAAWLLFAFVLVRHGANGASPGEIVGMFTFTDDQVDHPLATLVGQTWTLRVDMAFYVLVPLAAAIGVRVAGTRLGVAGRRWAVWAGTVAVAAVPLTVAALVPETTATTRSPATLLFLFMPGVAMAAALAGRRPAAFAHWAAPVGTALSIAGVAVLMAFPRDQLTLPYKLVIVGAGAAMALGGLVLLERRAGRPWRWMQSRVVRWVGRRTYGIYLWHLALMAELVVLFGDSAHPAHTYAMLLPLVLLATLVAAELSFRFVERPAMRRLRDPAGRASVAAAESAPPAATPTPIPPARPVAAASANKPHRRHVATADPLRGLAVLAVVAVHVPAGAMYVTGYLKGAGGTLRPETAFGPVIGLVLDALPTAVYLFFALSGFLIARPFVEAFISGAPLPSLRSYARNRLLRIFPAAWLFMTFVFFKYGDRGADPGELLSMITLTESYTPHPLESLAGQLWSLKVELSFYVLVPVVSVVLWRLRHRVPQARRKPLVCALAAAGAGVSLVYCTLESWGPPQQRTLQWTLIAFMSGVVLAAVLAGAERRPAGRRIRALAIAAFAGGLALSLYSAHSGSGPAVANMLATLSVTGILWGPVALEVLTGHTWRLLDNRVLAWFGDRSYAIYLFHLLVMAQLYPLILSMGIEGYKVAYLVLLPLVLVASAAVAEVSWRLVEGPAMRLKRRSSDPAPPAVTAAGLLAPNPWQMTLGERAAMEGLLARLKPALAIEIGTAEGGSTRCLARHCTEIHSFDLVHPQGLTEELPMVTTHTGDSHELLPAFLEQLAAAGRRVDFVLVDGDHSADGARRDVEDLLASPAVEGAAIVLHDSANDEVRAGLRAAAIEDHPSVAYLDLDFVAGHLSAPGMPYEGQLWGGLGLVIADPAARAAGRCVQPDLFEPAGDLLRVARDVREAPYPAAAA